jgi:hypothetical protein
MTVQRYGARIRVHYKKHLLFDYEDPKPIAGGHVGFWTVRNGFVLARANSSAERVERVGDLLYVADDDPSPWKPLITDSVRISRVADSPGCWRVASTTGTGFRAVRYVPEGPVELRKTPVLRIPLKAGEARNLNLFLTIDGEAYMLPICGSRSRMKSLLTPKYERGECFRIPVLKEKDLQKRILVETAKVGGGELKVNLAMALAPLKPGKTTLLLTNLTLGTTDNENYALAGSGDGPGLGYVVGVPAFEAGPVPRLEGDVDEWE